MLERNKILLATIMLVVVILLYLCTIFIFTTIRVDEGWAHSSALGKIEYGYYTMPAFYDIEIFKEQNYLIRQIDHLYRFAILTVGRGPNSIKLVRFISTILLFFSLYYYLNNQPYINALFDKLIMANLILLFVFIVGFGVTAREEILITSVLLFLMGILHKYTDIQGNILKKTEVILLSILCLFIHPNGLFIILGTSLLLLFEFKKNLQLIKYYILIVFLGLFYFIFLIDYNFYKYQEQLTLMAFSGDYKKFIVSFSDIIYFLKQELTRYYIHRFTESIYHALISLSIMVFVIGGLIFGMLDFKKYKRELVYSIVLFFCFILLGNKSIMYLSYLIPFTCLIFSVSVFKYINTKYRNLFFSVLFFVLFIIISGHVFKFYRSDNKSQKMLDSIYKEVPLGAKVYAPFGLEPYLSKDYNYYTTTHKDQMNFYKKFDIDLKKSYVIIDKKNPIFNYIKDKSYALDTLSSINKDLFLVYIRE